MAKYALCNQNRILWKLNDKKIVPVFYLHLQRYINVPWRATNLICISGTLILVLILHQTSSSAIAPCFYTFHDDKKILHGDDSVKFNRSSEQPNSRHYII